MRVDLLKIVKSDPSKYEELKDRLDQLQEFWVPDKRDLAEAINDLYKLPPEWKLMYAKTIVRYLI